MFCAFDGNPKILRLFGDATVTHPRDKTWQALENLFEPHPCARQYVDFRFDFLQTSCGFDVPFYDYKEERDNFPKWLAEKDSGAIKEYWGLKNQVSIEGLPTHILDKE